MIDLGSKICWVTLILLVLIGNFTKVSEGDDKEHESVSKLTNCDSDTHSDKTAETCTKKHSHGEEAQENFKSMEKIDFDQVDKVICPITPETYEGPFFLPDQPIREDIREDRQGVPLRINFKVKNAQNCNPVSGAQVHLWHSDAMGIYSAYSGYYPLGHPDSKQITGPHAEPTEEATFLRGRQITDSEGKASFLTIFPGWYKFRTIHAHFKVTVDGKSVYTGEIYFPDEFSNKILQVTPYNSHSGKRRLNTDDQQFLQKDVEQLIMTPEGSIEKGFTGDMEVVVQL